ncbi:protein NO VEIN domain-containing protein [Pseudarthrobacter sp. MDT3-1]
MSPTQYATALSWLRDLELLEKVGSPIPLANLVLGAIFENAAPPWVQDADELVQSPDELPSDIVLAGEALGLDANGVFEQLATSWGKVDTAVRERVGAAGEAALVSILRESADGSVDHVSTWSDGFGYDIAFAQGAVSAHLEVKSTTRTGRFTAYLSRHEYSVMLRDHRWVLVAVRLTAGLEIAGVGSVPRDWIAANVSRDVGLSGSWASCKLEVPAEIIEDHVAQLGADVANRLPPWRPLQPHE